jgi:hypothetical protein
VQGRVYMCTRTKQATSIRSREEIEEIKKVVEQGKEQSAE